MQDAYASEAGIRIGRWASGQSERSSLLDVVRQGEGAFGQGRVQPEEGSLYGILLREDLMEAREIAIGCAGIMHDF